MSFIYLIAFILTLIAIVIAYELKLSRADADIKKANETIDIHRQRLVEMLIASERAVVDLEVMFEMLKCTYTEEEIDKLYEEKMNEYIAKMLSEYGDVDDE